MTEKKKNVAIVGGLFALGALLIVTGLLMSHISTHASDGVVNIEPSATENTQQGVKYTYNVDNSEVEFYLGSNLYYDGSKLALNFDNTSSKTLSVNIKQAAITKVSADNIKSMGRTPVLRSDNLNTGGCEIVVDVVDDNGIIQAHLIGIEGHIEKVDSVSEFVN